VLPTEESEATITGARCELSVFGVSKSYGKRQILDDVCIVVHAGQVAALTGENGAGKSTLMRICAGLEGYESGRIDIPGTLGYCPQMPALFDLLTADEHLVMFGAGYGMPRDVAIERGHALLDEFDFPVGRKIVTADMSGGTRQKLNLVLSLLHDPDLLLLDEPYQGFDHGTYVNFWDHCTRWSSEGKAVVVVTHMLAELDRADHVIELPAHPAQKRPH
jgi:ABC-type multidrug transport system ATPase subunit